MVLPSENIIAMNKVRSLSSDLKMALRMPRYEMLCRCLNSTLNLGVFPPLLSADSFPLLAESNLCCEGTVIGVTCRRSVLRSVWGPEPLLS